MTHSFPTRRSSDLLPDEDWVTLSQQGLQPVTAGRFFVHNMADDPVPAQAKAFLIEAGQAFGTGQHETTEGCLLMLDRIRRLGQRHDNRSEEHTSELQSLMRISYAVFCLKNKTK